MRSMVLSVVVVVLLQIPSWCQHTHVASASTKLEIRDEGNNRLRLRLGPVALPASTAHAAMLTPAPQIFAVPFDGWITAYHPRLTNGAGATLPGRLLHHVAFWNLERNDLLCPARKEHIFGAGGELSDWPALPDVGYRVHAGDRIKITSMFHNPSPDSYGDAYLEVGLEYATRRSGAALRDVFPAWFDVKGCGESSYDVAPGTSVMTGEFKLMHAGVLLGVGGHLHDYGRQLTLSDKTHHRQISQLDSKTDADGHLLSIPVVTFGPNGYRLGQGDVISVAATYANPICGAICTPRTVSCAPS